MVAAPSASAMMAFAPGLARWAMSRPVERSESCAARSKSERSSAVNRSVNVEVLVLMLRVRIAQTLAHIDRNFRTFIGRSWNISLV